MSDSLYIGTPVGWGVMHYDTALYWCRVLQEDAPDAGFARCQIGALPIGRIMQCRNIMCDQAKELGSTHLMMVDPDMNPDVLYGVNGKRFVVEAKAFLDEHPRCIVGAPACSNFPQRNINVFMPDEVNGVRALEHAEAKDFVGWHQVRGVGTGLVMFRVDILDDIDTTRSPYYYDIYKDMRHLDLQSSQDITFCINAAKAGIDTYVNFDCWCGHYKTTCVMPDFVAEQVHKHAFGT